MNKATRQQYASAAKARRQKQILAGLGVVLVAVLVFQGPKMLKMLNGSSSAPSTTTTTSSPGTAQPASSAAPMTATPVPAVAGVGLAAGPSGVADASPPRIKSQIFSFERFDSKNPFVQQVTTPTAPPASAPPAAAAPTPSSGSPAPAPSASAPAATGTTGTAVTTPATASYGASQPQAVSAVSATTGTALISVNGKSEMVAPGQAFPTANPTFKLVSIADGTALIGLVGGTYASGTATVTLVPGRALTLVDTTDGVRYQLQLDALSAK